MATVFRQIINGFRPMHLTALVMAMVSAFLIVTVLSITPVGALNIDPSAAPDPTATPPTSNGITPTPPAAAAPTAAAPTAASGDEEDEIVCVGGPLGYITCPLIQLTTLMIGGIANFLDTLFNFQALGDSALREAWGAFVNLANIILAIGFLVVIMSQASSIGISSYGVKRILPRIVAGAILINMSFYVCALAVDASNVLGHNMMSFTASLTAGTVDSGGSTGNTDVGGVAAPSDCGGGLTEKFLGKSTACLLDIVGVGLSGGFLVATIFIFIMLVATFIAFATTLALVIMRYVILIFLILLAPLAFAAWVLPNTEQYFKKWWTLFMKLLVIYPAAMFLFGGSIFVARLLGDLDIKEMFGDASIPDVVAQAMWAAFQLFIIAMPLFFIPKLFKGLDGVTGGLSAKLAKAGSAGAMYQGAKKGYKGSALGQYNAMKKAERNALAGGGLYEGRNPLLRARSKVNRSINKATPGGYGAYRERFAAQHVHKAERDRVEQVKAKYDLAGQSDDIDFMQTEFGSAIDSGDAARIRASGDILAASGSAGIDRMRSELKKREGKDLGQHTASALNSTLKSNFSGLVAKRGDVGKSFVLPKPDGKHVLEMGKLSALSPDQASSQTSNALIDAVRSGTAPSQKIAQTVLNSKMETSDAKAEYIYQEIASGRGEQLKTYLDSEKARIDAEQAQQGIAPKDEHAYSVNVPERSRQDWVNAIAPGTQASRVPNGAPVHSDFNDRDG